LPEGTIRVVSSAGLAFTTMVFALATMSYSAVKDVGMLRLARWRISSELDWSRSSRSAAED